MSHTSCGQSSRTSAHYKEKSTSVTWRQKTVISGHRSFFEHKLMLSSQISKLSVVLNTTWEQCLLTQVACVVKINTIIRKRAAWHETKAERMNPGLAFRVTMGDRRLMGHILSWQSSSRVSRWEHFKILVSCLNFVNIAETQQAICWSSF